MMEPTHIYKNPMDNNTIPETSIKQPCWWARRTGLERKLLVFLIFLTVIIVGLIIALALAPESIETEGDVCTSVECLEAAKIFMTNMNPEIDPCDDFYEFACGKFLNKTTIPPDLSSVDSFSSIVEELHGELNYLLSEPKNTKDPACFNLAKEYFNQCMHIFAVESDAKGTFNQLIDAYDGWPILWKHSPPITPDWEKRLLNLYKGGLTISFPFYIGISIDDKNTSRNVIKIYPPDFGLNREYLIRGENDSIVQAYKTYMNSIAVALGATESQAKNQVQEMLEFEILLAKASPSQEEMRDPYARYHFYTLDSLNKEFKFGNIDWIDFFNEMVYPHTTVDGNDPVILSSPKYMAKLQELSQKKRFSKRLMENLIMWKFVSNMVPYSGQEFRKHLQEFNKVTKGIVSTPPRWKLCVDMTNAILDTPTGSMYVRRHFNINSKQQIISIVKDIMHEFKMRLKDLPWMDENTRNSAKRKVKKMSMHVGYSDEILNDKIIDEYYDNVNITGMSLMYSTLELCKHSHIKEISRLHKPVNLSDWTYHLGQTAEVNAYYMGIHNSIALPAGILRGIYYSAGKPKYLNYGGIGFIVGHEITHGFDDEGSQMNEDGNLKNWWANETRQQYLEKAQCIIEQYSNYTYENIHLNGLNTLGENIADNGGLGVVYSAYANWLDNNGPEKVLPGLPYTSKQMFWLSAASSWCAVQRPENVKFAITTDTHAPSKFRVLGPMSNLEEFSRDFNCKVGSNMNPQKKCKVW